jgi:hypothetical protein
LGVAGESPVEGPSRLVNSENCGMIMMVSIRSCGGSVWAKSGCGLVARGCAPGPFFCCSGRLRRLLWTCVSPFAEYQRFPLCQCEIAQAVPVAPVPCIPTAVCFNRDKTTVRVEWNARCHMWCMLNGAAADAEGMVSITAIGPAGESWRKPTGGHK